MRKGFKSKVALLLAALLTFGGLAALPVAAADITNEITFTVGSDSGELGTTVNLPVTLTGDDLAADKLKAIKLEITLDTGLTWNSTAFTAGNMTVEDSDVTAQVLSLELSSTSGVTGGVVVTLNIDIDADATVGGLGVAIVSTDGAGDSDNYDGAALLNADGVVTAEKITWSNALTLVNTTAAGDDRADGTATPRVGDVLTATIGGSTPAFTNPIYTFVDAGSNTLQTGSGETYTVVVGALDKTIKVTVSSDNYKDKTLASATAVVKKKVGPAAPIAPTLTTHFTAGSTSVTVAASGTYAANVATNEFYVGASAPTDGASWTAGTGSELAVPAPMGTSNLKLYVRVKETADTEAGEYASSGTFATSAGTLAGAVGISGTLKLGEPQTATYTPGNSSQGNLDFKWYYVASTETNPNTATKTLIAGATSSTYTPNDASLIGKKLIVTATPKSGMGTGSLNAITGGTLAQGKYATPSAPTLVEITSTSVTVKAEAGYRYSKDGGSTWQTTGTFTGYSAGGSYSIIQQRTASSDGAWAASDNSAALTGATPSGTQTVAISGTTRFDSTLSATAGAGVTSPTYQWYRDGVAIAGATASTYKLVAADVGKVISVMATGSGGSVKVSAKTAAIGKQVGPAAPTAAPTLASKTATSVKLTVVSGYEYRIGAAGAVNKTGEFTGLTANTAYTFYQRVYATDTHEESGWSPLLNVTTDVATTPTPPPSGGTIYSPGSTTTAASPTPSGAPGTATAKPAPQPMKPTDPAGTKAAAQASDNTLSLSGKDTVMPGVLVKGYNWLKLRDIAMLLNGTGKQFAIGYDAKTNTITITTGKAYEPVGDELKTLLTGNINAFASPQKIIFNGKTIDVAAYIIGGYNYFRLRDLAILLNFGVAYKDSVVTLDLAATYSE